MQRLQHASSWCSRKAARDTLSCLAEHYFIWLIAVVIRYIFDLKQGVCFLFNVWARQSQLQSFEAGQTGFCE